MGTLLLRAVCSGGAGAAGRRAVRPQERLAGSTLPRLSRWYMSTWSAMVPPLHLQMAVLCGGGQEATAELERLEFASLRPQERLAGSGRPRFCRKCQVRSLKCWSMLSRQTVFWPQPALALQRLWLPVCKRRNSLAEEGLAPMCLFAGSSLVCWSERRSWRPAKWRPWGCRAYMEILLPYLTIPCPALAGVEAVGAVAGARGFLRPYPTLPSPILE